MATLSVQQLVKNGAADVVWTASGATPFENEFANDGKTKVLVWNAGTGAHTCTATVNKDSGGLVTETGTAYSIGQDEIAVLGPFAPDIFNDSSGNVKLTMDADDSITIAVLRDAPR